jgi:2,4-dienoyl-CoA reductase-like NADH-dependent reductase (Old Yellow Enzyme family)
MDQFWSPLTNTLDGPYGGNRWKTACGFRLM